jgi:hypothetical protein
MVNRPGTPGAFRPRSGVLFALALAPDFAVSGPRHQDKGTSVRSKNLPQYQFLVQLDGPLACHSALQNLLGYEPKVLKGSSVEEDSKAYFIRVEALEKQRIAAWLAEKHHTFVPTFVSQRVARKVLEIASVARMLGFESTLPHHRLLSADQIPQPAQDEYPVWYFFYGTLADPEHLKALLGEVDGAKDGYELRPARIRGGRLETRPGGDKKYKGLVDDFDRRNMVKGPAFLV